MGEFVKNELAEKRGYSYRLTRRQFLVAGSAAALAACGPAAVTPSASPSASPGKELKIGVLLPFTGVYAELGNSMRRATELSVNAFYAQLITKVGPEKVVAVAQKLGISVLYPVMHMRRVMFTTADRPFEIVETFYRADKYHYSVNLVRVKRKGKWTWKTEVETSA